MVGESRFKEIIEKYADRNILLYGDPDVDGLFSLKLLCDFFDMLGLKYVRHVNGNRVHGFELDQELLSGYLVVAADFSITREEMEVLVANNIACICIDHHKCEDTFIDVVGETAEGIVLNNQYPFEPEEDRYLSGAGVVYELFVSVVPAFKKREREAIVGITLLSDIRAIENKKAHKYLAKTYTDDSDYIKYLVNATLRSDYGFGVPRMDRDFIDFTFSPTINAMLRFNKVEEAIGLIFGSGGSETDYHALQKELVNRIMQDVEVLPLDSVTILAVDASKYEEDISNFIGLICSQYKNMGVSALIFAYKSDTVIRASFRGRFDDLEYLNEFRSLGIDANGHEPAFGIKKFNPYPGLYQIINEHISSMEDGHKDTRTLIDTYNLAVSLIRDGSNIAYDNCYVRDMYRTYYRYTGNNIKELRHTYRMSEFDDNDYAESRKPDKKVKGVSYKYDLDSSGNRITKFIEYLIDGRVVKAFNDKKGDLLILPILEKGYMQLYAV